MLVQGFGGGLPSEGLAGSGVESKGDSVGEVVGLRLSDRVEENVRRYIAGEPLLGIVDIAGGY